MVSFGLLLSFSMTLLDMAPLALNQIKNELPMTPVHSGDLLYRFNAWAQGADAPSIGELPGPGRGLIGPELPEILLEQIGAHAS